MKRPLLIFGVFLLLTLIMTYPLIFRLGSSARDMGDPMLNTWILSWDIQQLLHLNISGFFDANIFYPQKKTLTYSEHLFPQSLVALPVKLLSGNPVLAHNVIVLLAFLTTGMGMFFLARYLTRDTLAGLAAGLIFAFSPFMFAHLYQVQVLTAGGLPLAFLFLHKFFSNDRLKGLLLFGLFFCVQALANGYYALYLTLFAGIFIIVFALVRKKYSDFRFLWKLTICAILIVLCLRPFFYQYVRFQKDMGFKRDIGNYASLTSFLATSSINVLYGKVTARFLHSEGELFPGLTAFALAFCGALWALRIKKKMPQDMKESAGPADRPQKLRRALLWIVTLAAWVYGGMLYLILTIGGFTVHLGPLGTIHAHSAIKTGALVLALLAAGIALRRFGRPPTPRLLHVSLDWASPWMYMLILVLAFLFTFGPHGPYVLLYKFLPGFTGMRVASRFHIFVMFGLAVLAAYGMAGLNRRLKGRKARNVLLVLPLFFIMVEYLSVPVPLVRVPVKDKIPQVYQWLGRQPGDWPVVELPFPTRNERYGKECARIYYSTYHWKKLVNGYSGFFPPVYLELVRRYSAFPIAQLVRDFKDLGVRMMIVHSSELEDRQGRRLLNALAKLQGEVREVARFQDDIVFELLAAPGQGSAVPDNIRLRPEIIPRQSWSARASVNAGQAAKAFDGSIETRWDTAGPQKKDQWFELDLGRVVRTRGLSLKLGLNSTDSPRGIRIEVSMDGENWSEVSHEERVAIPIRMFLDPKQLSLDIPIAPADARYIKLVQTGDDPVYYWSIYELEVWAAE